jgi:hypothetical protein
MEPVTKTILFSSRLRFLPTKLLGLENTAKRSGYSNKRAGGREILAFAILKFRNKSVSEKPYT